MSARSLRWLTLLVSLAIEAMAFWWAGPAGGPDADFWSTLVLKANSAAAWTWLGWISLTLTWLWLELVLYPFSNRRRIRAVASAGGEEVIYETGLHWLVLLRDIWTGELNDGNEDELNEGLFADRKSPRSFTWYAVWLPIQLAILTTLFFIGWVAWSIRKSPETLKGLCDAAREFVHAHMDWPVIGSLSDGFLTALPDWLKSFAATARDNPVLVVLWLIALWFVLYLGGTLFKSVYIVSLPLRVMRWLTLLGLLFAISATAPFDWVTRVYGILDNNGPVAMGFFPLNLASMFLVLHLALWSSWRYGILRVPATRDASLVLVGGIFNYYKREFQLERIVETRISQAWWQRLLGVGDMEIVEIGGARTDIIKHIAGPNTLDRAIKRAIQQRRNRETAE